MSMPDVQNPSPPTTTSPTTPRPKRRRPAATGAANDCFTCTSNNVSCDRKRPYCTPCLTGGKDCAGYKTTLTWGVGVASRGKLRGLSLPVAGSAQPTPARSQSGIRKRPSGQDAALPRRRLQKSLIMAASADLFSPLSPVAFPQTQPVTDASRTVWSYPPSPLPQQIPSQQILLSSSTIDEPPQSSKSDQPQYSVPHLIDERFREPSCVSPDEPGRPLESNGYFNYPPLPPKGRSYSLNAATSLPRHNLTVWSPQGLNEGSSPSISDDSSLSHISFPWHASDFGALEPERTAPNWTAKANKTKLRGGQEVDHAVSGLSHQQDGHGTVYREAVVPEQIAIVLTPPPSGTHAIGNTPRMRYLIQYYAEVMTPVLVASDGPTNPFRVHILRMALGSDTLQHAISALAASNLRQRRQNGQVSSGRTESAKRSSLAYLRLTDKGWLTMPGYLPEEEQRQEEGYHKNATVQLMQKQFSDPSQYRDNALLATLLIVCLYHMCESGIAKFRAHFAAAKKLLGMHEMSSIMNSEELRWLARMLTLYDTMTATTSDREPEMQPHLIEMASSSSEAWAMETLAGCDGQLFKIIAGLGRLKVLSGHYTPTHETLISPTSYLDPPTPAGPHPYWGHFSGDVWRTHEVEASSPQTPIPEISYSTTHPLFGREWNEMRTNLLSWTADLPTPLSDDHQQQQQLDLLNTSEAYRFSALAYVERLALPSSPCSDSRIQVWIQKALHHISLVSNNVHLLWPLFITGSETITESDRHLVRQRCLEIQRDSGFASNTSCLRILEQIWMTNPEPCLEFIPPPGFRWAPFLRCNTPGGEYLVL